MTKILNAFGKNKNLSGYKLLHVVKKSVSNILIHSSAYSVLATMHGNKNIIVYKTESLPSWNLALVQGWFGASTVV